MKPPDDTGAATKPQPPIVYAPPVEPFLDVVHVDGDFLFVVKPSGLLSVPGRGAHLSDCVASRAVTLFPDAMIVHRLDLETSGLMVMARNRAAQRWLNRQFEKRQVCKVYVARVAGVIGSDEGEVDLPLICDWPNRPRQMVDQAHGKPALTRWQVIAREGDATRMCLMPVTGRAHQLRVHMSSMGHPVLGDSLYADPVACEAADRLQLHAQRLTLQHPSGGRTLTCEAPCPF